MEGADDERDGGGEDGGEDDDGTAATSSTGSAAAASTTTTAARKRPRPEASSGPKKRKKSDETAYWCFTWNNPPDGYEEFIKGLFDDDDKDLEYVVYGREVGESGTFHLQGFVQFGTPITREEVLLNNGPAQRLFQAHWTKARRIQKARDYCLKDGDYVEHGTFCMRQGKRTDLDEFKAAVEAGGMTPRIARKMYSETYARYHRFAEAYINDHKKPPTVETHPMYQWQLALNDYIQNRPVSDREVIFVVDTVGNTGKTWFAKYLYAQSHNGGKKVQYMTPGKINDMSHNLEEDLEAIVIDCPRSRLEMFQYDFIEYIKNELVFSPKYESKMKVIPKCHVVVFMNEEPDRTKLSKDRYTIMNVDRHLASVPRPPVTRTENEPGTEGEEVQTVEEDPDKVTDWDSYLRYKAKQEAENPRTPGFASYFFPGAQLGR